MRVLITNDDGIFAPGLNSLVKEFVNSGHQVSVIAPDGERSACGHAITVHHPIRVKEGVISGIESYAVNGTPADCVKLGLNVLIETPQMVISGINSGPNLGTDVLYSGTVSAAIEAALDNIPAIAISLNGSGKLDYSYSARFAVELARKYNHNPLPSGTLINVNVPNIVEQNIAGVRITKLGERKYLNNFEKRLDPRGGTYFWMAGEPDESDPHHDSDVWAISNNFISITPIHFDLTNHYFIKELKKWEISLP